MSETPLSKIEAVGTVFSSVILQLPLGESENNAFQWRENASPVDGHFLSENNEAYVKLWALEQMETRKSFKLIISKKLRMGRGDVISKGNLKHTYTTEFTKMEAVIKHHVQEKEYNKKKNKELIPLGEKTLQKYKHD